LVGYVALGVEAMLPIPQVLANQKSRSCTGFRLSVLISWLIGDTMKTIFFYSSDHIGLQFKLCAGVQFALDAYMGVQFWMFGSGETSKDVEMNLADMRLS
jgi:solute carrier family 66, member 2